MRLPPLEMLRSPVRSVFRRGCGAGLLCGVYLVGFVHPLFASVGTSLPTTAAVAFALIVFFVCGLTEPRRPVLPLRRSASGFGWLHFALAAWTVALPWLLDVVEWLLAALPESILFSPPGAFACTVVVTAIVAGAPVYWIASLGVRLDDMMHRASGNSPDEDADRVHALQAFAIGLGVGLLLDAFVFAPLFGVWWSGLAAAAVGVGVFIRCLVVDVQSADNIPKLQHQRPPSASWSTLAWTVAVFTALGVAYAVVACVLRQLLPTAAFLVWTAWAALPVGFGFAGSLAGRRSLSTATFACLAAAMWIVTIVALFPVLVRGVLLLNVYVSWVDLSMALRALLVFVVVLPIGVCGGICHGDARGHSELFRCVRFGIPAFVAGWLLARWWAIPEWGPAGVGIGAAWVLAALGCVPSFRLGLTFRSAWTRAAIGACLIAVACAPLVRSHHNPAHAAKLLFSTDVFLAHRQGESILQVAVLDETRPLDLTHSREATYSLWKAQGARLQLRADGVPGGLASADTRICPQFSGDVLPVVLPLVLHEDAEQVLLLGLGAGTQTTTALMFPVRHVTCIEADQRRIELVRNHVWSNVDESSWDNRLTMRVAEPALAVTDRAQPYDVVVSNPGPSSLWSATPYFTRTFYQRAAERLAPNGLFCQRFQQTDYGPGPLRAVVRTLQSVFSNVAAFETAPGEIVLIGSNSPDGIALDGLAERLQAPHVRRVLADIGADWSFVLELPAYDDAALAEFAVESPAGANTAINGNFAFALPREMMRWGAKWQQLQEQLSPHRSRLLEWIGDEGEDPDVLDRLAEAAAARQLKASQADRWWLYRKALREQVQQRPRAVIQPVKHEGLSHGLHPEDQRRMDYFRALSHAFEQRRPSHENIEYVASFAEPYDPLLSEFVHFEVARLYERAGRPDVRTELLHRLHTVYYADTADRAVQNVAAAIALLIDHPQAMPDAAERFDHLNALLQVLKQRWNNRAGGTPADVDQALNDLRDSITTAESALSTMDGLVQSSALPADDWQARRSHLDRTLIRPLRTYRDRLQMRRRRPKPAE